MMKDASIPPVRKRRRRGGINSEASSRRARPDLVDDTRLCLSENNYPPRQQPNASSIKSLPALLYQRESGLVLGSKIGRWQKRVLLEESKNNNGGPKKVWRAYAARRVSFIDLETPYSEFLLALDPTGSYMLTISDEKTASTSGDEPSAYVCIRGVPSPSRLDSIGAAPRGPPSPRIMTVPLDFSSRGVMGRFRSKKVIFSLCQDWRMGLVLCPNSSRPRDLRAAITVFPLPAALHAQTDVVKVFKSLPALSFIDIAASLEGFNILWDVGIVPQNSSDMGGNVGLGCKFRRQGASFCVFRHGSEIRMTWFAEAGASISNGMSLLSTGAASPSQATSLPRLSQTHTLEGILLVPVESFWSAAHSRRLDGALVESPDLEVPGQLEIAHEAVLLIDRLVGDILRRRPQLAKRYEAPEFRLEWKIEIVDVVENGRVLNVLIAFSPGKASQLMAAVVSIDLLSNSYREKSWLRSATPFADLDTRTVCARLRMEMLQIGPYECGIDDAEYGLGQEKGSPGVHFTRLGGENCFMPLSAIYRDCQVVSNSNILCSVPRMCIKSCSPVEIAYFGEG
jgi:hypothetical protein